MFARLIAIYFLFLMEGIFHVSSNIKRLPLLLCYLPVPFHQLASPPRFHFAHISRGNLIHTYKCILLPFGIYFSSGHGSFLVLSPPWLAGSPRTPHASLARAEVRGTCSAGLKSHVPPGRHSEHLEPSKSLQTQVQVERISDSSCDISVFERHQCRRTILTW